MRAFIWKRVLPVVGLLFLLGETQGWGAEEKLSEVISSFADNGRAYADIIRAQAEYIRMVGEARLQWAKARLVEAQVAHEMEEVRKLHLLVNRMQLELKRLGHDEYKNRVMINQLEQASNRFRIISTGKTSDAVFQAMRFLFIKAVPTSLTAEVMSIKVGPFGAEQFVSNRHEETESFAGGSIGQLEHFLEMHHYSFEPYAEAHIAFLTAIAKVFTTSALKVAEIRSYIEKLRLGTLDIWNAPGVKPVGTPVPKDGAAPPPPNAPGPVAPPVSEQPPSKSHQFCMAAKGGYKACRTDGGSADQCRLADNGYLDCRNDGNNARFCVPAKSGYKACRDDGNLPQECLPADSGYVECRKDGYLPFLCIPAKSGYRECRSEGFPREMCLAADKGYRDCRNDGYGPHECIIARGAYKFCREDGFAFSRCISVGKGYDQCRKNGFPPSQCFSADQGYKDCYGGPDPL